MSYQAQRWVLTLPSAEMAVILGCPLNGEWMSEGTGAGDDRWEAAVQGLVRVAVFCPPSSCGAGRLVAVCPPPVGPSAAARDRTVAL